MDREELREQNAAVEASIAACMSRLGFEYIALDPDQGLSETEAGSDFVRSREDVEKFGFYINTLGTRPFDTVEIVDPNEGRLQSLSEAERAAYDAALFGDGTAAEPTPQETTTDGLSRAPQDELTDSQMGCYGVAQKKFRGMADDLSIIENPDYKALVEKAENIHEQIMRDPAVADATNRYSDCVGAAGYPDVGPVGGAKFLVAQKTAEVYDYKFNDLGDNAYSVESLSQGEMPPLPTADQAQKLRDLEISVALADYDCRDKFDSVFNKTSTIIETEFIEDNAKLIERIQASLAK